MHYNPRLIRAISLGALLLCGRVDAGATAKKTVSKAGGVKPSAQLLAKARELEAKEGAAETATASAGNEPRYTKAQQIAWHLQVARTAWTNKDKEAAIANWREVLRLDRGNAEALSALRDATVNDSKRALKAFAQARGITSLADALDDRTDDQIAQRLIIFDRNAIQKVDGSLDSSPDPALYDDFENFIDGNGLGRLVSMAELGQEVPYYNGRIYGRKFLETLASWVQRIERSGIHVQVTYPFNSEHAADDMDKFNFTIEPTGEVAIDGPNVGPSIPLFAVWQDGEYRIAPKAGFHLIYQFNVQTEARRWRN